MPSYDVLIYRDFVDTIDELQEGAKSEDIGLGERLTVVVVGPPIHEGRAGTVVLMHGSVPTPEIREKFS